MTEILSDVSRETLEKLRIFEAMVLKWTHRINLVSLKDRSILWDRHIKDSVQIFEAAPSGLQHWLDLGSGGGFPGVVVAIMAAERDPTARVTLVESDGRKAAFLRSALRESGANARVLDLRIEDMSPQEADVISARALARLDLLLELAHPHCAENGTCVFPKGADWQSEVAEAKRRWRFDHSAANSKLDPQAVILKVKDIHRVQA